MKSALTLFSVVSCTLLACSAGLPTGPALAGMRVLFIGNSLTIANDLPGTVAAIAASGGDTLGVQMVAAPGVALIDLAKSSETTAAIHAHDGGWVVMQQGPTPRGICRDTLVLAAELLAGPIRAAHAEPALFMPWSAVGGQSWADEVLGSFEAAAASIGGTFMPAGAAWRIALAEDPSLRLYGSDDFHPSPTGTFLAALVIYERITGKDARALPTLAFANGRPLALPDDTIRLLQAAAHRANQEHDARPAPAAGAAAVIQAATTC